MTKKLSATALWQSPINLLYGERYNKYILGMANLAKGLSIAEKEVNFLYLICIKPRDVEENFIKFRFRAFLDDSVTAMVKPLLKKLGLQLINTNYRPVSNLKFLSKLVKKCMWSQHQSALS